MHAHTHTLDFSFDWKTHAWLDKNEKKKIINGYDAFVTFNKMKRILTPPYAMRKKSKRINKK